MAVGQPRVSRTQEERNAIAKAKLMRAALELFALQGIEATTLAEIGIRAGYSRGLAQYHFPTKAKLAEHLLDDMGRRDLQADVLRLAPGATGAQAWQQLMRHLDDSWANFRSMHDGSEENLAARGEMILSATATFSPDPELRKKLGQVSSLLIAPVTEVLRVCAADDFIRRETDVDAIARFYVASIWGIVNALFAAPDHLNRIAPMVGVLRDFMNTLRT